MIDPPFCFCFLDANVELNIIFFVFFLNQEKRSRKRNFSQV